MRPNPSHSPRKHIKTLLFTEPPTQTQDRGYDRPPERDWPDRDRGYDRGPDRERERGFARERPERFERHAGLFADNTRLVRSKFLTERRIE